MKKALFIILLLLAASIAVNVWLWNKEPQIETIVETKTDTLWKDTTITEPQPTNSQKTGRVIYITIPGDTIHDSIVIELAEQQKRYDDSLYTAWVSGYEPKLDSISLRLPTITETTTITNTVYHEPLFTFGLQAGAGYGLLNHHPDIYIGVGGTMRLWRSKRTKR